MASEQGKLYQDRLYGTKVLSPLAVALMDSAEFQRLAGLRQLGFSDIAYRAAQHTRFEHSVGTYFVCRTMLRRIVQNHERLQWPHTEPPQWPHPGSFISERFATYPDNWAPNTVKVATPSYQARWRNEISSRAALLHDLGHVPYGHTLEDEFTGIYARHDSLGGPRLHEMLFHRDSDLASIFSDDREPWIKSHTNPGIKNSELAQLIYLMLNWKESIEPPLGFEAVIDNKLKDMTGGKAADRLQELRSWHSLFLNSKLFKPFMSDVIGNTICADLMDYLPRDRQNLGMEVRYHQRLQRYLTIREGRLYPDEGPRLSIMVTRKGHGGQRRDVTTAVLDIMRERYEMAERVYYHHKKAAASTMLAKLAELATKVGQKPRGEEGIYPAPWSKPHDEDDQEYDSPKVTKPPHMVHLSDWSLVDYLGTQVVLEQPEDKKLQAALYRGLRYDRKSIYRTLLVIDGGLVTSSPYTIAYYSEAFRGPPNLPSSSERMRLEKELSAAAGGDNGDVLIYCPSAHMQAKLVDARMEISEGRILPLRVQRESFANMADLKVLEDYYRDLWRAYVFVKPKLFFKSENCKALVDKLCHHFRIPPLEAYDKVRLHDWKLAGWGIGRQALVSIRNFLDTTGIIEIPQDVVSALLGEASTDPKYLESLANSQDGSQRLTALFAGLCYDWVIRDGADRPQLMPSDRSTIRKMRPAIATERIIPRVAARKDGETNQKFSSYLDDLLSFVRQQPSDDNEQKHQLF